MSRRWKSAAVAAMAALFVLALVAPLYGAVKACTMSCCHRAPTEATLTTTTGNCQVPPCTVKAANSTAATVATPAPRDTSVAPVAMASVASAVLPALSDDVRPQPPPRGAAAHDLQLLNSTFRI